MTRGIALRPSTVDEPDPGFSELVCSGYQWRVTPALAPIIKGGSIDWRSLADLPGAERIKHNCQRDVWRVSLDGRDFFIKVSHPHGLVARLKLLFRGPTAVEEWNVGRYAAAFAIAAVRPGACAWTGTQGTGGPSILVSEAVADSRPLNEYWLRVRDDRVQADAVIESLAALIARAHQCGFQHGDMHPGNILIGGGGGAPSAYFVDLHKVRMGRSVSLRSIVANLAQLNQWFRRHATRSQRLRFLRRYLSDRDRFGQASAYARNWTIDPRHLSIDLARQAKRHAEKLWGKRDRRANRSGRYFARLRLGSGWGCIAMLRSKHPTAAAQASRSTFTESQWRDWLEDPLRWIDPARVTLLKDSHTATVCRARLPATPEPAEVIIKRTLPRNLWKRLSQMFGPSRNRRAWRMANMLINRDLPAAQPLAVVERRWAGLVRLDSLLITEFIQGSVDLEAFLTRDVAALPTSGQRRVKDELIRAAVSFVKAFHDRGFAHRDFKAPNVLVSWEPPFEGRPRLTLIDMEGIRFAGVVSEDRSRRALVRLCVSLMSSPGCTRTDRLRFLQAMMVGPGRTARGWKREWGILAELSRSKLDRKDRRRQWKRKHYGRE